MAVLQTAYTDQVAPGYAGMVANAETSNRITRTNEDAASLAFGRPAFRGTGDHGCTATPGAGFLGIAIAHETLGLLGGATPDAYPTTASVPIMTLGVIWVNASVAVAKGDQAYVTSAGLLTNVATGNTILTGWFFDTSTAAAGLAKLAKR